ncbi:MAG: type II toxin-antitoxin system PemK/MazF family toxin [Campylobacterales bacterium]|nr:type II toxin-antitoxin system PemK/MazF family toxin [Campylobacterales bacterium]
MIDSLNKYDVVVVKFPFASSLKYKARPAVIVSTEYYNKNSRGTYLILAISSQVESRLEIEEEITFWNEANLLKPSIFKSSVATIEKENVISKLGSLSEVDMKRLEKMISVIC